ncbi:MAG: family 1 glycosylhydrolase [Anaerolineaceae bacterium]|nr:family 1 glycosylhydrolase [Anaerolineaceae bacterium]
MKDFTFPNNFIWGTATSAHQVEGNNINSDNWVMEHLAGSAFVEPSGDACDHYHRYPEDIALLAKLGFNAYRFSIEWARIEPEEGEFSMAELEHYRRMLAACHEHGITPMVTFHHFTTPRWLMREGGWLGEKTPDRFARYCEKATRHLGDLMGGACTLNEPNLSALLGYLLPFKMNEQPWWPLAADTFGVPPDRFGSFLFADPTQAHEVIVSSHRKAVEAIKSVGYDFPVGLTLALVDFQCIEGGEGLFTKIRYNTGGNFLERLQGDDFVGVQTYTRTRINADGLMDPPEGAEKNQMGEEFYPQSIGNTVRYAAEASGLPVYVTENGLASEDDTQRVKFYRQAIQSVAQAMQDGVDVRGYFCWSAFDNFEWVSGYGPKFGIIAVDRETQVRTVKPSAEYVGKLARANKIRME